jgi:MFS family permease
LRKGDITNPQTANLATGGVGIALFLSSWIPVFYFDRLGRKTWLQIGTIGMMLSMLGIAALQHKAEEYPESDVKYIIILFPYLFNIFFNIRRGVAAWTYPFEIFPLSMRVRGKALSTSVNEASCFVVAQIYTVLGDAIGWGLYIIYGVIWVFDFPFVWFALGMSPADFLFNAN